MTHTPEQLLAEKCAKFNGDKINPVIDKVDYYFHNDLSAPYNMHLAKREMEKLGYDIESNKFIGQGYQWRIKKDNPRIIERLKAKELSDEELNQYLGNRWERKWQIDKNIFIAFWSAVEATGVMEDKG